MQEEYLVPEQCTTKLLIKDLSQIAANMVIYSVLDYEKKTAVP